MARTPISGERWTAHRHLFYPMILSLAVALLATAGGALATYLYDEGAPFGARLCTGCCTGLALLGLVGFIVSSFLGLTPVAIALATLLLFSPALLLIDEDRRRRVQTDWQVTW